MRGQGTQQLGCTSVLDPGWTEREVGSAGRVGGGKLEPHQLRRVRTRCLHSVLTRPLARPKQSRRRRRQWRRKGRGPRGASPKPRRGWRREAMAAGQDVPLRPRHAKGRWTKTASPGSTRTAACTSCPRQDVSSVQSRAFLSLHTRLMTRSRRRRPARNPARAKGSHCVELLGLHSCVCSGAMSSIGIKTSQLRCERASTSGEFAAKAVAERPSQWLPC